jgi:hypothetical protein
MGTQDLVSKEWRLDKSYDKKPGSIEITISSIEPVDFAG